MDTREAGRRGGIAHARKRLAGDLQSDAQPLTLEQVKAKLPPMADADSVKQRLELICNWAAAGLMAGSAAGACVRSCEVWLKLHDSEIDRKHLKELERHVKQLEAELAARGGLRRIS